MALKRAVGLNLVSESWNLLLVSTGLLGQENGLDVGQDTSLGDGDSAQELVQLLVVADGQLQVAGVDSGLLVVAGSVAGQLEHFSGEVFENSGQVDLKSDKSQSDQEIERVQEETNRCSGSDALSVVALAEHAVQTTDWELESGSRGARLGLATGLGLSTLSTSRHC